jgi:hypothetical protein
MEIMHPIRTILTARLMLAGLLIASLAVVGCGRSQPDERAATPPQPAPATTAPAPAGGPGTGQPNLLPDGRHPFFVSTKESPPPNDYYTRNVNPRLRTVPVRADATITVNSLGFGSQADHQVSLARLATLIRSDDHWPPFWITVRHGQVVRIAQQWVP